MRTKKYASIFAAAVALATASQATDINSPTYEFTAESFNSPLNIIGGDAGGNCYLWASVTSNKQVRDLTWSGADNAYKSTLTVGNGIHAIMNFSTTEMGGVSTPMDIGFRFGGSANDVGGSAVVQGAGKGSSTFTFHGERFDTGHVAGPSYAALAKDTMTFKSITFNYNGTTQFGSNNVAIEDAVVNVNNGYLTAVGGDTYSLKNSTFNIASTYTGGTLTNNRFKLGALAMENSSLKIAQASGVVAANTTALTGANVVSASALGSLGAVTFAAGASLELQLSDTAKILITDFAGGGDLILSDFGTENLFLTTTAKDKIADGISIFGDAAKTKSLAEGVDFEFAAASYNGVDGYWVNAIPEPSTFAALFGALALAFAAYRRRNA